MDRMAFQKWQGAGNDFIIIDNREGPYDSLSAGQVKWLCDRHFGIGADGLMMIGPNQPFDFEMVYYNSDGLPAEMCGNGGRCITAMASRLGLFQGKARFMASDGPHEAVVVREDWIRLKMKDVDNIQKTEVPWPSAATPSTGFFLNTGVPHLVIFASDLELIDVQTDGRLIRYLETFAPAGTNVNFVDIRDNHLEIRTYERGVEAETLACGTGNVASALAAAFAHGAGHSQFHCHARGGELAVSFTKTGESTFADIWLEGPAVLVYEGVIALS